MKKLYYLTLTVILLLPIFYNLAYSQISIESPLQQYKSGTIPNQVQCNNNLQLIIKAEDGSPACVKPDTANILIERGWAKNSSTVPVDPLKFSLSVNPMIVKQNQSVAIDITLNNTSQDTIFKAYNSRLTMDMLTRGPCDWLEPFGIAMFEGNYSLDNIKDGKPISLWAGGTYNCQMITYITGYSWQPSSDKVTETGGLNYAREMKYHDSFGGFYGDNNTVHKFAPGEYTVVAGDEWGHLAMQHFIVEN